MGVSSSEPSQHRSSCSDSSFSPSLWPILRWLTPTGSATATPTLALPVLTPPPTPAMLPPPMLPLLMLLPPLPPLLMPSLPPMSEPQLPTDSDFLSPSSSGATRLPTKQQPKRQKAFHSRRHNLRQTPCALVENRQSVMVELTTV